MRADHMGGERRPSATFALLEDLSILRATVRTEDVWL